MAKFKKNSAVEWPWGRGHASAKVKEIFTDSVTRTIKGKKITRHGTKEVPAYLLVQENGNLILKLESELKKAERLHGWA